MRKTLVLLIAFSLITSGVYANSKKRGRFSRYYLRVDAGVSFPMSAPSPDIYFYQATTGNSNKGPKASGLLGVGMGYIFNKYVRTDVSAVYRPNFTYEYANSTGSSVEDESSAVSQTFSSATLMNNWYYHLNLPTTVFFPYLHFGLGVTKNYSSAFKYVLMGEDPEEVTAASGIKYNFTYAAGCGLKVRLTENLYSDIYYRYVNFNKFSKAYYRFKYAPERSIHLSPQLSSHEIGFGIIYNFN